MFAHKLPTLALLAPLLIAGCKQNLINSEPNPTTSLPAEAPLYMRMTDRDVALADAAVQQALESNQSMTSLGWSNPDSRNGGEVMPVRTFKNLLGLYCRTYRESLKIGLESETYTDTACRREDGQWYPI